MTYDGSFALTKISKIKVPNVLSTYSYFAYHPPYEARNRMYSNAEHQYWYGRWQGLGQGLVRAPKSDFTNFEWIEGSQAASGSAGTVNSAIYVVLPTPYNNYFWAYGTTVWKAHVNTPETWVNTGTAVPAGMNLSSFYIDGSNVYFYGGDDAAGTYHDKILTASLSNPEVVTDTGQVLPIVASGLCVVTIGTDIYIYGARTTAGVEQTNIWTATTAAPTIVTDTLAVLPDLSSTMSAYTDATYVWFYGAGTNNDRIFRTDLTTPTVVTDEAAMPAGNQSLGPNPIMTDATDIYFFVRTSAFYNYGGIYKASKLTPQTQTVVSPTIVTASCNAAVAVIDGRMFSFGGHDAAGAALDTINSTSPIYSNSWSLSGSVLPGAIKGATCIKTSQYLYIFGGQTANGNVYRAALATPETWEIAHTTGPTRNFGQAMIIDGNTLYYLGGESAVGTAVTTIWRAQIVNGEIIGTSWTKTDTGFNYALPAVLSRFNLIVAGNYIYALNGYTTAGALSTAIYRADKRKFLSFSGANFINIGTVSSGVIEAATVVSNGMVYICGGGNTGYNDATNRVTRMSLSDLANSRAILTYEAAGMVGTTGGASAVFSNDRLYLIGNKNVANGFGTASIDKSFCNEEYETISLNLFPDHPGLVIDPLTGALGQTSLHQTTGMLPWLVTKY